MRMRSDLLSLRPLHILNVMIHLDQIEHREGYQEVDGLEWEMWNTGSTARNEKGNYLLVFSFTVSLPLVFFWPQLWQKSALLIKEEWQFEQKWLFSWIEFCSSKNVKSLFECKIDFLSFTEYGFILNWKNDS